jgi:ATP-dependent helicase/nuclease subunit B
VIVDYKSSGKKLDPVFLHHGMQLQLLAYLNALVHLPDPEKVFSAKKILPAGVFYVPLRAKSESADTRYAVLGRTPADALAAYQHTGRFDGKVLLQLDNRGLDKGDQFKFAKKKDGDFHKRGEAMTTEAFRALLMKIEDDLRQHGERIFSGNIAAKPYRKGNDRACDWCQCQPVCRFDSWIHPYHVLRKPPEENEESKKEGK